MAGKIPGLSRVLDTRSIASVAYGEIASSLYFALGVVALHALGFTPWVLLAVGGLFLLVSLSYAEGTAAIPETGGAATFVRRAFNDPAGFLTGWALLLDYLIVIALAALFLPHYLGNAVGWDAITAGPWDAVIGVGVIVAIAGIRLVRRPGLYRVAVVVAFTALVSHLLIVFLGLALLVSSDGLSSGVDLGVAPTWQAIAFALPLAMLAYTGLETVANFAAETREPGRTLPRSLFAGIGAAVLVSFAVGVVGISAYPAHADPSGPGGYASDLGVEWLRAPLVGIAVAFEGSLPSLAVDLLRAFLGVTGSLVLVGAVTTSISGAGRLAYSLGRHQMLPHAFGVLNRRTLIAPVSIVSAAAISCALLVLTAPLEREVRFLASLYSFGVLIAFTAAQVAVIRLRFTEPALARPFRVPVNVRIRGTRVPLAALLGAPLTFAIWVSALATHGASRIAGPIWLLLGIIVFVAVRRSAGERLLKRVQAPVADLVPAAEGVYQRILVPLKLGPIGEEVLATALRLADERRCGIDVLHVIRVPLDRDLDAELTAEEERAEASLADAKELASEHGVTISGEIVRGRALGEAIVRRAKERGADLIVMGSAPRWRRQSRFFSPTVDYVLRKADCEVMVVAYPQGVLDEDGAEA
ncbi:MAG: universal stress protein [Actinobacteria bacterium]|nr:universal stress protein [Actinomycetota bacterium]